MIPASEGTAPPFCLPIKTGKMAGGNVSWPGKYPRPCMPAGFCGLQDLFSMNMGQENSFYRTVFRLKSVVLANCIAKRVGNVVHPY